MNQRIALMVFAVVPPKNTTNFLYIANGWANY